MQRNEITMEKMTPSARLLAFIGRFALALFIPVIAFFVLYQGFLFLKAGDAPKWVITFVAIIWGVGGVAALYWIFNWLVEQLPDLWRTKLQPFIFVGPAMAILTWYLALPTLRTLYISLFDRMGPELGEFVGLANYVEVFTNRLMLEAFRNNIFFNGRTNSGATGKHYAVKINGTAAMYWMQ